MTKIKLPNVTLLGIDCVDVDRLIKAMDISQKNIEFGAVKLLTSLPATYKDCVKIPHIGSIEDLSKFCILELHKYVETDHVLIVQYDGFVLHSNMWNQEFMKYDYIGAPISVKESWGMPDYSPSPFIVGNGGFSLRSKRLLELSAQLVVDRKITKFHPEDISLCVWHRDIFEDQNITYAPIELAMRFSVQEDYGQYEQSFGFHGCYGKNMDALKNKYHDYPLYYFLPKVRAKRVIRIKDIFEDIAIESHLYGSLARGDADNFSDIDIWITFKDEDFQSILARRIDLYGQVGEIIHIVEPPQNAPVNGIQSSVLYKTKVGLIMIDYTLCPRSSSSLGKDNKKLFGDIEIPFGDPVLNSKKSHVDKNYRLDFFISFIFNAIKQIARKDTNPLDDVFREYNNLVNLYGYSLVSIDTTDHSFNNLRNIYRLIFEHATKKQRNALLEIGIFLDNIQENIE